MLPVLYKFVADTPTAQALMYVLGFFLVIYSARSGWAGAVGPVNPATGEFTEPTKQDRQNRAIKYALAGVGLVALGLYYAMPASAFFGKGKGEGIPIHTYGVLVGGGFISATTVLAWLAEREWLGEEGKKKRDQMFDMAFTLFVAAIIGSRVLFIIVNWKDYAAQPSRIFDLSGGLVFYGGLIGASIAGFLYARKHNIEFLRLGDLAMPTVSLGQCLGRLGCFSAGCCWGQVTTKAMPFAVSFPGREVKNVFGGAGDTPSLAFQSQMSDLRWVVESTGQVLHDSAPGAVQIASWVRDHGHTLPVHPTQMYESLGQLVIFATLMTLRRYKRFHGQIMGMWLMSYAVLRTSVELFRGDVERGTFHGLLESMHLDGLATAVPLEAWYNISISQFISLCMFSLGAYVVQRGYMRFRAAPKLELEPLPVG